MSNEAERGGSKHFYRDVCAAEVTVFFVKFPMKAMIAFVSLL